MGLTANFNKQSKELDLVKNTNQEKIIQKIIFKRENYSKLKKMEEK